MFVFDIFPQYSLGGIFAETCRYFCFAANVWIAGLVNGSTIKLISDKSKPETCLEQLFDSTIHRKSTFMLFFTSVFSAGPTAKITALS